jgi:tRNA uracil 4-sulfurtransferase
MNNYLCRYGEIAIKGKNRINFERQLVRNMKYLLKRNKIEADVKKIMGGVLVESSEECDCLKNVFGLVSYSRCHVVNSEDELKEKLVELLKLRKFNTFRLSLNRADKNYPKRRIEMQREIGLFLGAKGFEANLTEFDLEVFIEVFSKEFIIHFEKVKCFGGLPWSIEGRLYALIENNDSLKAALLMMRRGCEILPVAFEEKDISILYDFGNKNRLRIIKDLSELEDLPLVVKDILPNFQDYESRVVFRPLIGYSNNLFEGYL